MMNRFFQKFTDIMCVGLLMVCFFSAFGMGAYNHVMRDIAMERLMSMSIAELGQVKARI